MCAPTVCTRPPRASASRWSSTANGVLSSTTGVWRLMPSIVDDTNARLAGVSGKALAEVEPRRHVVARKALAAPDRRERRAARRRAYFSTRAIVARSFQNGMNSRYIRPGCSSSGRPSACADVDPLDQIRVERADAPLLLRLRGRRAEFVGREELERVDIARGDVAVPRRACRRATPPRAARPESDRCAAPIGRTESSRSARTPPRPSTGRR